MKTQIFSMFVALMFMLSVVSVAFAQDVADTAVSDTEVSANTETAEAETTTEVEAEDSAETEVDEIEDNTVEVVEEEAPETETEVEVEVEAELEAADAGEVGNATQEETEIMTDIPGVKVRLLQLQERLERNIVHGEEIIARVSTNGTDVSKLQSILDQLKALKDEVAAIDPSGVPVNEATAQFVAIKQKAIRLSKEFKTEARKLVKADKRAALKERLKAKEAQRLSRIKDRVKVARDEHNAEVFAELLEKLGERFPELVAQLKSGEITVKEAKAKIREEFKSLSKEKKDQARLKLKERVSKERVKRLEVRQELRTKGLVKARERIEKRLETRETEGLVKARERITTRIESSGNKTEVETEVESDNSGSGSESSGSGSG